MDDKDFKKKFEEANPNIKLVRRTKERTEALAKRVTFALGGMGLFIFMGIMSGAPLWVHFVVVPLIGAIGYFGAPSGK